MFNHVTGIVAGKDDVSVRTCNLLDYEEGR